eukprot:COSAG02_NODE_1977_length_10205_cov_5.317633_11_plen_606_part_00
MLAAAAFFAVAVEATSAAPLITTATKVVAPLNPTVGDVIKHHANLTSFAASLVSANLSSFLGEPTAFGVFGYTVLAPSDAAFSALPEAMKGMFDVESLRYEILSHHINLRTTTPNAVCAAATAPLPGYNVTTMASQALSILCYTCPGARGGDACPTVLATQTLGNATFTITATPIVASNGVVVVIDGILLPAWLPPAQVPIRPAPPADNEPLVFRAINHARRDCGQVDAASSVPPAIYKDEGNLKRYIDLTLEHFQMPGGLQLELGTCAEAGYTTVDAQRPPETIAWDTGDLFSYYCASDLSTEEDGGGCGCVIGLCPDLPPPDKPICAICNAVTNRDRKVKFFVHGSTPRPPPPPDIFGFVLDALANTPELSIINRIVQGNQTKDSGGRPYLRECPRGHTSLDCSYPEIGRQYFTGTIESKGPWTFFAPDNAAFTKAPAVKAALLAGFRDGQNPGYLDDAFDTLYYHLLAGNYSAAKLPSGETNTLLGADITTSHLGKHFTFVTGGITSNVARVKKSIEVMNGIVRLALLVFFMPDIIILYTPYKHCSEGQTNLSAQVHIISVVLAPPADTKPSKQQGYNTCCAAGVAQSCCDACCKAGNNQCC